MSELWIWLALTYIILAVTAGWYLDDLAIAVGVLITGALVIGGGALLIT